MQITLFLFKHLGILYPKYEKPGGMNFLLHRPCLKRSPHQRVTFNLCGCCNVFQVNGIYQDH